jgi:hypothetical protein
MPSSKRSTRAYRAQERRIKRLTPAKKLANAIALGEQFATENGTLRADVMALNQTIERLTNHCRELETYKREQEQLKGPYGGKRVDLEKALKAKAIADSVAEVRLAKIKTLEDELVRVRDAAVARQKERWKEHSGAAKAKRQRSARSSKSAGHRHRARGR